jgi:hypothetical protein
MSGVTRAVEKAGQQLGIVKKVAQTGGAQIPEAPQPAATAPAAPSAKTAATAMDEAVAARRRARRGARALLSEQRLTPEQGIGSTTLGAGPMQ